jgi:hypothetical protein
MLGCREALKRKTFRQDQQDHTDDEKMFAPARRRRKRSIASGE